MDVFLSLVGWLMFLIGVFVVWSTFATPHGTDIQLILAAIVFTASGVFLGSAEIIRAIRDSGQKPAAAQTARAVDERTVG